MMDSEPHYRPTAFASCWNRDRQAYGVQIRYIHNYVTPELFINVMCSFGTYVYELIHVYVVTLSISDSVVNIDVIE